MLQRHKSLSQVNQFHLSLLAPVAKRFLLPSHTSALTCPYHCNTVGINNTEKNWTASQINLDIGTEQ